MAKWKMKSIKHSGTCGERGTDRQEPYYLARNNCTVEFEISELKIGYPVVLYYSPKEEYHGNGILTSKLSKFEEYKENGEVFIKIETENSIFLMKAVD